MPEPLRAAVQHIGPVHDKIGLLHDKRHRLVDALSVAELHWPP